MKRTLDCTFFNRDTKLVARELLGKFLARKAKGTEISVMITETEAYDGFDDKASHAWRGKTARNEAMFGHPGTFYVYLCYGMHFMLNIVTRDHGYPAAVLIRGCRYNIGNADLNGPGKVARFLSIGKELNCAPASEKTGLWLEDRRVAVKKSSIIKAARIGVGYAGPVWSAKKMRFVLHR